MARVSSLDYSSLLPVTQKLNPIKEVLNIDTDFEQHCDNLRENAHNLLQFLVNLSQSENGAQKIQHFAEPALQLFDDLKDVLDNIMSIFTFEELQENVEVNTDNDVMVKPANKTSEGRSENGGESEMLSFLEERLEGDEYRLILSRISTPPPEPAYRYFKNTRQSLDPTNWHQVSRTFITTLNLITKNDIPIRLEMIQQAAKSEMKGSINIVECDQNYMILENLSDKEVNMSNYHLEQHLASCSTPVRRQLSDDLVLEPNTEIKLLLNSPLTPIQEDTESSVNCICLYDSNDTEIASSSNSTQNYQTDDPSEIENIWNTIDEQTHGVFIELMNSIALGNEHKNLDLYRKIRKTKLKYFKPLLTNGDEKLYRKAMVMTINLSISGSRELFQASFRPSVRSNLEISFIHPNGIFLVLFNHSKDEIKDVSSFKIVQVVDQTRTITFTLPENSVILPNAYLTIYGNNNKGIAIPAKSIIMEEHKYWADGDFVETTLFDCDGVKVSSHYQVSEYSKVSDRTKELLEKLDSDFIFNSG